MAGQIAEQQDRDLTLDTYRYLRGGMVVMVVMLAAGVIGAAISSHCWQGSISAYYYTSAHSVFIASLCALGVQMIVYRGSSDTEDALLNLAGMLAFIVAFVPTGMPERQCGEAGPWAKWEAAITTMCGRSSLLWYSRAWRRGCYTAAPTPAGGEAWAET